MKTVTLHWGDIVAVVVYFILILAVGFYSLCRANRGTVGGYFLAGRFMVWLPVGASLFASNIGSEHFIGLAGSGAVAGIGVAAFEVSALLILQLLGWVFLPVYIASRASTLPQFMMKRFGGQRIRVYLACLSMLLYIFTKISVNMYSGALFIQMSLGWNLYLAIFLLLSMTAICTITGGLAAVIYTETLQFFVMLTGGITLTIFSFQKVGGIVGLAEKYSLAIPNETIPNTTCGHPREDAWSLVRHPITGDIPWPGFWFGQITASIWYWCTDQMMVQRALAAKSLSHAQGGTILAGYIKLLPMFIMVMPGMISRVLYTDEVACIVPERCQEYCGSSTGCSNAAYPLLVFGLLPVGLRGVMLAVMFSALMSDLAAIFNSSSTLFTMDIWVLIRKNVTTRELLIVGRLFVIVMIVVSFLWVPVIQNMQGGQLFLYIQAVSSYLAPPVAAIYLLGILWKRFNEQGAFWGLMVGIVVGVSRMILDFIYREPSCGQPDTRPDIVSKVHFLYFALILFWSVTITGIIVSLLTKPPDEKMISHTTYWTRFDTHPKVDIIMDDKNAIANNYIPNGDAHVNFGADVNISVTSMQEVMQPEEQPNPNILKRFAKWFCGIDSSERIQLTTEYDSRLEKISSLKQDRRAKIFLNINLVIVISIVVFVFGYFSPNKPLFIPYNNSNV